MASKLAAHHDDEGDEYTEMELEELLLKNIEVVYQDGLDRVVSKGYTKPLSQESVNTLVRHNCSSGKLSLADSAFSDIVEKALAAAVIACEEDEQEQQEQEQEQQVVKLSLSDFRELGRFALAEMLSLIRNERPQLSKSQAMWSLLVSDMNIADALNLEVVDNNVGKQQQQKQPKDDEVPSTSASPACSSIKSQPFVVAVADAGYPLESERLVGPAQAAARPKCKDPESEEGSCDKKSMSPDAVEGVVAVSEQDEAGSVSEVLGLQQRVKDLETQLRERTDWAQKRVLQAAQRLSKDFNELKKLRAERDEAARTEESNCKKLGDMEASLRKLTSQLDQVKTKLIKSEAEKARMRAELEAAKLNEAESFASLMEMSKRERQSAKKAQNWEKQRAKLQDELCAERRMVAEMHQQLVQAKDRQQQAEARIRQETKAKEDVEARLEAEKLAKEQAEAGGKRREAALQRKAEADSRRLRDDILRLEKEVRSLRMDSAPALSWERSTNTRAAGEHKQRQLMSAEEWQAAIIRRDRECVMCLCEEMSVVFLPCAHQVVCSSCNEQHEKQGMNDCPSCRTPIQQRLRVYGAAS